MFKLDTFQNYADTEFNEQVLDAATLEIIRLIKANATSFRIVIDITSDTIDYKLYKNAITYYFMKIGYKIVNYPTFLYIDWGRVNFYQQNYVGKPSLDSLGDSFTAYDLYAYLTDSNDLRGLSYRILEYQVNRDVANMKWYGQTTKISTFGLQCTMEADLLNAMFAPELALYAKRNPNTLLSFVDGGNIRITRDTPAVLYTDIPIKVMFGADI